MGLVAGRGGGGLLGGFGLGFGATDGDGKDLELVSESGGLFCCSKYAGTGSGLTTGWTVECLDLGVPVGVGCWLVSCGKITTIWHYAVLKPSMQFTDTEGDILPLCPC